MQILNHVVLYRDDEYFCAFPSAVRTPRGEIIVAFRRAPERRPYGGRCTHGDPNSQLVLIRSLDDGRSWSQQPELIHAHAMGGSQDPCLTLLDDGSLLCASYLWVLQQPACPVGGEYDHTGWKQTFAGGYLVRSTDLGQRWSQPILPPPLPGDAARDAFGKPLPAYNRGNILQGSDGLLYWAVVRAEVAIVRGIGGSRTSVHLIVSGNGGISWEYRCPIAVDSSVDFNETYLYETASGTLVAFLRTADESGLVVNAIARSTDRGRSFAKWQPLPFAGHPHCAAALPDGRVLLAYGCREKPYGIRARVINAECDDIAGATEHVIRDDGGSKDLGYPWPIVFPDGRVLLTYYMNHDGDVPAAWPAPALNDEHGMTALGGVRYIAGTWLRP
jgi:sialidase-1